MMKLRAFVCIAALLVSAPAFAACKTYPTPDNAPVYGAKAFPDAGSNANLGGTAYTKATFCPAAAAAGTCTGESLSEKVKGNVDPNFFFGNIGNVPDNHKNGFYIGPVFIPTSPLLPGACT
jgi:hypothetical protein